MEPVVSTNVAYGSIHTSTATGSHSTNTTVYDTPICVTSSRKPSSETECEFIESSKTAASHHVYIDHVKPTQGATIIYDKPVCAEGPCDKEGSDKGTDTSESVASHIYIDGSMEYLRMLPSEEIDAKDEVAIKLKQNQSYSLTELPNTTQIKEDGIPFTANTCYEQTKIRRRKIIKKKRQPKYEKAIEVGVMVTALISTILSIMVIITVSVGITSNDLVVITNLNMSDSAAGNNLNLTVNFTDNVTTYLEMLQNIKSDLRNITAELVAIDDRIRLIQPHQIQQTFQSLNSRIDSIQDYINQLTVQATDTCRILSEQQHITEPVLLDDLGDQTCPVNITEGHQLTSFTIDIDNECTVMAGIACQVPSMFSCFTFGVAEFLKDDQILVDFTCYAVFSNPDIAGPANGTAAIRQESLINTTPNQNIFNDIISDTVDAVGCQCLSFESSELLSCRFMARFCNYKRGQVTSTIIT